MTELAAPAQIAIARDQALPLFRRIIERHQRRRDARLLAKLDDRMLRDIGLTRHDIEQLGKS
jgi:uncharacterized protein YjiS (DUF1127 family)